MNFCCLLVLACDVTTLQAQGAPVGGTQPVAKAKAVAAVVGRGSGTGTDSSKALHYQIKTLEEENASLRALSRALMAERQDLIDKLNSSSGAGAQVESLRQLCTSLQQQLRSAQESSGAIGVYKEEDSEGIDQSDMAEARRKGVEEDLDHDMPGWGPAAAVDARPPGHIPGSSPHSKMQRWPQQHRMPDLQHGGHPPAPRMALPTDSGGDLHSLSWMAPDFDLDELI
jgi:hypothetical protein